MQIRVASEPLMLMLWSLCFWGLVSCAPAPETVAAEDPSSSPLTVAHCRVNCLMEFVGNNQRDASCMQDPDCFSCWQNCELLHSNLSNSGSICSEKMGCFPGCRAACNFFDLFRMSPLQQRQQQPVLETNTADLLVVSGSELRWPRPPLSSTVVVVYVVMWRPNDTARWSQLTQTLERKARLPARRATPGGSARVLVVDPGGLRTVYSPAGARQPAPSDVDAVPVALREGGLPVLMGAPGGWVLPKPGVWSVRVLSLIHQGVLVIAELSWRVPKQDGERSVMGGHHQYLVTWEVDGGGITGNLLTDSTCVTLSLWPDTVFQIQVELVSRRLPVSRSQPLVVNTGRVLVDGPASRPHHVWLQGPLAPVLGAMLKAVVALLALFLCFRGFLWRSPQPEPDKAALVIDITKHESLLDSHWNASDEEAEPLPEKSRNISV